MPARYHMRRVERVHYGLAGGIYIVLAECGHVLKRAKVSTPPAHVLSCPQCEWDQDVRHEPDTFDEFPADRGRYLTRQMQDEILSTGLFNGTEVTQ